MFKKAESVFSLCIAFVCWDESEQAGQFQDAHGGVGVGVGEKVEVAGLCSGGSLVVLGVSEPQPECHIPFSG